VTLLDGDMPEYGTVGHCNKLHCCLVIFVVVKFCLYYVCSPGLCFAFCPFVCVVFAILHFAVFS